MSSQEGVITVARLGPMIVLLSVLFAAIIVLTVLVVDARNDIENMRSDLAKLECVHAYVDGEAMHTDSETVAHCLFP